MWKWHSYDRQGQEMKVKVGRLVGDSYKIYICRILHIYCLHPIILFMSDNKPLNCV